MKCALIDRYRGDYPLRLMCRVLEVSPSGYYRWRKSSPTARAIADDCLMAHVRLTFAANQGRYGAPRIHRALRTAGHRVGKKRVARLMRRAGLAARRPRRYVRTTDSAHPHPVAPNHLARQFDVNGVAMVNRVWVSDLTYVPTRAGFLYLAVVLDLASRRVIGWATRATLAADVALSALRMALDARQPRGGLLHHSDRGVQYACGAYQALLAEHGIVASMSRKGDCWDNAVVESFFATLELELIDGSDWRSHTEARQAIFRYIETWYNPHRLHSTLDYRSPIDYERALLAAA